jgi:hypothetical protein
MLLKMRRNFDIHWNFYPDGRLFPLERHVFTDSSIYLYGGLVGAVAGFFIIKLFLFGLKEEENLWKKESSRQRSRK